MTKAKFSPLDLTPNDLDDVVNHVLGDFPEDVVGHIRQAATTYSWVDQLTDMAIDFSNAGDTTKVRCLLKVIRHLAQDHEGYLLGVAERADASIKVAMKVGARDE